LAEAYAAIPKTPNEKPRILIAPSWQVDNIMELCIDDMLNVLLGHGYEIILRPHPQFIRLFPERIKTLIEQYAPYTQTGEIIFELDFTGNESVYMSDVLISDWSDISVEFSFCTLKPCICINTPMKVMNPNYYQYGIESQYITIRDKIGISVDVENVKDINEIIKNPRRRAAGY
jgi:YidC/Oxa1 family membrane protein insertase